MGRAIKKSFTLIELIIAVGIISLVLPPVFNIFFSMMRQQLILISYQTMKRQGDSAQKNIVNILQNRAAYITDSAYTATDVCPLPLTPTPTYSPDIYIKDRGGNSIHLYQKTISATANIIASYSANMDKTFNLTSTDVSISDLGFSCYLVNEFSPPVVSTTFTVYKSTAFKETSLPYYFEVRLKNY
ncbi:MAG: type II secretion system protein [bacterium]